MVKSRVARVSHYFSKIGVAVLELEAPLLVGDKILVTNNHVGFQQVVESMQLDGKSVDTAQAGQNIGLRIDQKVKSNFVVYKI
jgi:putative protease